MTTSTTSTITATIEIPQVLTRSEMVTMTMVEIRQASEARNQALYLHLGGSVEVAAVLSKMADAVAIRFDNVCSYIPSLEWSLAGGYFGKREGLTPVEYAKAVVAGEVKTCDRCFRNLAHCRGKKCNCK